MTRYAPLSGAREDYAWLNPVALTTLSRGYLREGIAKADLKEAAITRLDKMITTAEGFLGFKLPTMRYGVKRGWVSPASPVWSNFGAGRGLPISCNGSSMDDNMDSILFKNAEIGAMTKEGAGTSLYMGNLRGFGTEISTGGTSQGPLHFARLTQEQVTVVSQSNVRRGNCAIWLPIDHADIDRWMEIRSISGGVHHAIQHLSFGVTISRQWMAEMKAEEKGGPKRKLMAKIRNKRRETGYPYILFTDNANDHRPQVLKDRDLRILASNLCTEIMLPSSGDLSFVCDLSSVNVLFYDEWKNTPFIREMIAFLDAVMSEYIQKTAGKRLLADAHRFAVEWRALGLGTLGWHSLLQSKHLAFESAEAMELNREVHAYIWDESHAASKWLGELLGEAPGMVGTGYRNLTVNAIAPTTSSSIICGQVSQSIEPWMANIFENDNAKGVFTQRNVILGYFLDSIGKNTDEVWLSILQNGGSVQHLDFLSDNDKAVYKTNAEIDQKIVIQQAIDRQYAGIHGLDQGQSLNVILPPEASMKDDMDLIIMAEEGGLKSLYYRRGLNKAQELARANAACVACEA